MKRLSIQDAAFLHAESIECPIHIASVQIFDLPKRYAERRDFIPNLMKRFGDMQASAPFNQKLHSDWSKLDVWPSWVEDDKIDLDYHIRFVALPAPGDKDQLMRLVERLHEPVLDRNRPLWELYFIDGLEGNRIAVYFKTHHAMIDGVAGMSLVQSALSTEKKASGPLHPIWHVSKKKRPAPDKESFVATLRHRMEDAFAQVNSLQQSTGNFLRGEPDKLSHGSKPSLGRSQAPKTPFNVAITRHRHLDVFSLPLSRTKEIAKDFGATINDVVIAISGAAIRRHLQDVGQLPEKPVLAGVPVSVRPAGAEQEGNNVSIFAATTGSNIEDPIQRLKAVSLWAAGQKKKISGLTSVAAQNYATIFGLSALIPQLVGAGDFSMPPTNVVISNVPGWRHPLYLGDAKLSAIYPVSVLIDYQAFNITVLSREDSLDFGLIAAHESIEDLKQISTYMQEAFAELDAASTALLDAEVARVTEKVKARKKKPSKSTATTTRKKPGAKKTAPAKGTTKAKRKKAT